MAESELLCVRVATFNLEEICKHSKRDVIRKYTLSELSRFFILMF